MKFKSSEIHLLCLCVRACFLFYFAIELNWNWQKAINIHLDKNLPPNFFFFFLAGKFATKSIDCWTKGAATDPLGVLHNTWYVYLLKALKYTGF